MKKTVLSIVLPALLLLTAGSVSAQGKWKYELSLGGSLNSGNINNIGFKTDAAVNRNDSVLAFDGNLHYVYTEENHVATNNGFSGGIKFDVYQYDRWSPFFASEFITNHFKGYDLKVSILAGVKYRIFTIPGRCDYSVSAAFVGENVNYYVENPLADTLDGYVARISLRGKIKQRIGDHITLNHTTFYQPSVTDFSDYMVTSITKIEDKLSTHLFLDFIFTYEYRSVVPESRSRADYSTNVAIRLKF